MKIDFLFIFNSVLLGIGLSMDAFSVSLVNGLNEPDMKLSKVLAIVLSFSLFQMAMPLLGWLFVYALIEYFGLLEYLIPFIAFILLLVLGIKMIYEGKCLKEGSLNTTHIAFYTIFVQSIATSIDAFGVGFTIACYPFLMALLCTFIIGCITFILCLIGIKLGKNLGDRISDKASILGGIILILIGFEIFLTCFL